MRDVPERQDDDGHVLGGSWPRVSPRVSRRACEPPCEGVSSANRAPPAGVGLLDVPQGPQARAYIRVWDGSLHP